MANRYFKYASYTLETDTVRLFGSVAIGGSGAVGTTKGGGLTSITRTGVGAYTFTLNDTFSKPLAFYATFAGLASGIGGVELVSSLATQLTDIAAKQVKIQCYSATTTAADPANGTTMMFEIVLRNSNIGIWD